MSISSISSNSDYYQNYLTNGSTSLKQQGQQDFTSLADALQSGDLSGAQSAFASLLQLFPNLSPSANSPTQSTATSSAASSSSSTSSITNDLSTLGQAIQSGDLTGAQNDFSKLTQDMQSIGGGHHHHHHHKTSAGSQDATLASATGSTAGTNSVATDLAALGQALQSGDLKSAGYVYSLLTQDMQSVQQANNQQYALAGPQSTNSTVNSNAGFQQFLNTWTQLISAGNSINISA
jgi:CubicO group peptidase (beta-lactamase class C family)